MIHTVGPMWSGGWHGEREVLASCYRRSLELAGAAGLTTVAFPCISTGAYGYPRELAAEVAVGTVRVFVAQEPALQGVLFVCFTDWDLAAYEALLGRQGMG